MPGQGQQSRSKAMRHHDDGTGHGGPHAFFPVALSLWSLVLAAALSMPLRPAAAQEWPSLRGSLESQSQVEMPPATPAATGDDAPPAAPATMASPLPEDGARPDTTVPRIPTPDGIPVGAHRLRTDVETDVLVTDNVYQTDSGRTADIGERLSARLTLESAWTRHALRGSLQATETAWRETGLDDLALEARIDTRLDLARGHTADLAAGWRLAPETDGPERLAHALSVEAGWRVTAGILRPSIGIGIVRMIYTDRTVSGDQVNAGDDDYTEPELRLGLTLDRGGRLRPFVTGSYSWRRHDERRDSAGVPRDSHGGAVEAGVELDDAVWSGRLAVRYAARRYDDPATGTVKGLGLDAALTWRPDRLTTVDMTAGLAIDDTAVAGATAVRRYSGALRLARAVRENLTITAGVAADYADYAGSPDHEFTLSGALAAEWRLNRNLSLLAGWRIERQWSTFANGDYLENRLRLGLRHRF